MGEAWLTGASSPDCERALWGNRWGKLGNPCRRSGAETQLAHSSEFPLLVKFLFPNDKLSIQVHPADSYAAKYRTGCRRSRQDRDVAHCFLAAGRRNSFGPKNRRDQTGFSGCLSRITPSKIFLFIEAVQPGDTYFVSAGTQHAIGPNIVICEVQEYSDLTYRVYDFGRLDSSGKPRELHIEKALEVTNFDAPRGVRFLPWHYILRMPINTCWPPVNFSQPSDGIAEKRPLSKATANISS